MSHDPEEGVRVSAPAATVFSLSALLLSISVATELSKLLLLNQSLLVNYNGDQDYVCGDNDQTYQWGFSC